MKKKQKRRSTLRQILEEQQKRQKPSQFLHFSCNLSPVVTPLQISILPDLASTLSSRFKKENLFSQESSKKLLNENKRLVLTKTSKHSKKSKKFCLNYKPKFEQKQRKTQPQKSLKQTLLSWSRFGKSKKTIEHITEIPLLNYCQLLIRYKSNVQKMKKRRFIILLQELIQSYKDNVEELKSEVDDIVKLSQTLIECLESKDKDIELRSTGALEVNRDLARLIFHIVQELIFRKSNYQNVLKINKQIEFYSRRLNFHKLTLRVCFDIAEVYKEYLKDESESAYYYGKALRQAIFIGDKYYEEKAIDGLGLVSYLQGKIQGASFCHNKIEEIKSFQRSMKSQQFSNQKQILELYREKKERILHINEHYNKENAQNKQFRETYTEKKREHENYTFLKGQCEQQTFDQKNKQIFKENIKNYIQCPNMRERTLIANQKMNKISRIGFTKKLLFSQKPFRMRKYDLLNSSREIMLTHRSFNRYNPDSEYQEIEKQKKTILDFLYYLSKKSVKFIETEKC